MTIQGSEGPPPVRREIIVRQKDIFNDVVQRLRQNRERLRIAADTGKNEGFVYDEEAKTAIRFRNVYIVPRGIRLSRRIDQRVAALNAFMIEVRNDLYEHLQLGDCIEINEATGEEGRGVQTGSIYVVKDPLIFQETMLKGRLRVFEPVPQVRGRPLEGYRFVEAMRIAVFPNQKAVQLATALS